MPQPTVLEGFKDPMGESQNAFMYTDAKGEHAYMSAAKAGTSGSDPGWYGLPPDSSYRAEAWSQCQILNFDGKHLTNATGYSCLEYYVQLEPIIPLADDILNVIRHKGYMHVPVTVGLSGQAEVEDEAPGNILSFLVEAEASAALWGDDGQTIYESPPCVANVAAPKAAFGNVVSATIRFVPVVSLEMGHMYIYLMVKAGSPLVFSDEYATGRVTASAKADPAIAFDQAAFDQVAAAMGLPAFNLADYFTFQYGDPANYRSPLTLSKPDLIDSCDTGPSWTDNITGDTTPTFTGTVEDPLADLGMPAPTLAILYVDCVEAGRARITNGRYTITASTLPPGEHAVMVTAGSDEDAMGMPSEVLMITVDEGLPPGEETQAGLGAGGFKAVTFTDADGTTATIRLSRGDATLRFEGDDIVEVVGKTGTTVTGTNLYLAEIALSGDTSRGTLSFTLRNARGSDRQIDVGTITSTGAVQSITGRNVNLLGTVDLGGPVGSLTLNDLRGAQHTITLGGSPLDKGAAISLGHVTDLTLTSGSPIRSLTVAGWADTEGDDLLTAPSLARLTCTGDFTASLAVTGLGVQPGKLALGPVKVTGRIGGGAWAVFGNASTLRAGSTGTDWAAVVDGTIKSVTVNGNASGGIQALSIGAFKVTGNLEDAIVTVLQPPVDGKPRVRALTSFNVGGTMTNAILDSAGHVGTVSLGRMTGSTVFAGVDTDRNPPGLLPDEQEDFNAFASLDVFTIRGIKGQAVSFEDSYVAAARLGSVTLLGLPANNTASGGLACDVLGKTYVRKAGRLTALRVRGPLDLPAMFEELDGYVGRLV